MKKANIPSSFTFVQEQCPWFTEEGTVNLDTWEKVGKQLRDYYTLNGPEKVPTNTFSLWGMIRDALDPTYESEKVKVKGNEDDDGSQPNYQQLRQMLAAMNTDSHPEGRDKEEKQLLPLDEEDLEKAETHYHSDEDWPFSAQDAPKSLRDTSPTRPSVKSNSKTPKVSVERDKRGIEQF